MNSERYNPLDLLLPYQKKIVFSKSNRVICNCSRQIGKSFLGAAKSVLYAISNPSTLTACISTGERAANEFLLKCRQWARAFSVVIQELVAFQESSSSIRFSNGSRIITLPSGNPASLRGYSGNIVLDEFALVEQDEEVWAAIAPLLTSKMNNKDKWCLILSTPTSLDTRFAKIWFDQSDEWEKHQLTIFDAVSEGLKADPENLKKLINDEFIWNTEYMCQFASGIDTAFPPELLSDLSLDVAPFDKSLPSYIGADIARTNDLTVFSVLQKKENHYNIVKLVTLKNSPFIDQITELQNLFRQYNVSSGYIDATGIGNMFSEEAARQISSRLKPFTFTAASKTEIFDRLKKVITDNSFRCDKTYEEQIKSDLALVRRCLSKTGTISYTAPHTPSGHADIACSLALALAAEHDLAASFALPEPYTRSSRFGLASSGTRYF